MGDCVFCDQPAGWLKTAHPECTAKYKKDQARIKARAKTGDEIQLLVPVDDVIELVACTRFLSSWIDVSHKFAEIELKQDDKDLADRLQALGQSLHAMMDKDCLNRCDDSTLMYGAMSPYLRHQRYFSMYEYTHNVENINHVVKDMRQLAKTLLDELEERVPNMDCESDAEWLSGWISHERRYWSEKKA